MSLRTLKEQIADIRARNEEVPDTLDTGSFDLKSNVIVTKGSIEEKIRFDNETNRRIRVQEEELHSKGIFKHGKDKACWGDYGKNKTAEKFLNDIRRHPKEKGRIGSDYHKWQAQQRKYGEYVK